MQQVLLGSSLSLYSGFHSTLKLVHHLKVTAHVETSPTPITGTGTSITSRKLVTMLVDESATVDILCRTSRMEREGDKDRWPRLGLGMLSQLNNVYENPQLPIEQLSENQQLPIEQRF